MPEILPVSKIIRNRRTVKPAVMDPQLEVPRDLIEELFENANWAPTHGFTEPWRFKVFTGDTRQQLASQLQELYCEHTSEGQFRQDKLDKLGRNPMLAPVVIAICMRRGDNPKIPVIEEIESVACAVQNMHLTASAAGLGAFWSSPQVLETGGMRSFLGLREEDCCLGLFYLGWLKEGERWPESSRHPAAEKVEWI
ncbi:MAG: nitroreductase [Verrucomicrobiales bacterium]|jgi:nitroreductase